MNLADDISVIMNYYDATLLEQFKLQYQKEQRRDADVHPPKKILIEVDHHMIEPPEIPLSPKILLQKTGELRHVNPPIEPKPVSKTKPARGPSVPARDEDGQCDCDLLEQTIEMLQRQLPKDAVTELVTLEEAKHRAADATDDAEIEKWNDFVMKHPDFIEQQRVEKLQWLDDNAVANEEAFRKVKGLVSDDFVEMQDAGVPSDLVKRVKNNKVLLFVVKHKDTVAKTNIADLRSVLLSNLTPTEIRAVWTAIPDAFVPPSDEKAKWKDMLFEAMRRAVKRDLTKNEKRIESLWSETPKFNPDRVVAPVVVAKSTVDDKTSDHLNMDALRKADRTAAPQANAAVPKPPPVPPKLPSPPPLSNMPAGKKAPAAAASSPAFTGAITGLRDMSPAEKLKHVREQKALAKQSAAAGGPIPVTAPPIPPPNMPKSNKAPVAASPSALTGAITGLRDMSPAEQLRRVKEHKELAKRAAVAGSTPVPGTPTSSPPQSPPQSTSPSKPKAPGRRGSTMLTPKP